MRIYVLLDVTIDKVSEIIGEVVVLCVSIDSLSKRTLPANCPRQMMHKNTVAVIFYVISQSKASFHSKPIRYQTET